MSHAFASATRDEWGEHLAETDACVEPVLEMEELADHPHHQARHMFYSVDDPVRGLIPQLRLPLDLPPGREPAPRLGEHTDEVLEEAGVGPEEIAQLRSARVIR
jgi:crotonobetainyl-CoA:carnitine CoA-transferase CaiB-like acyl-CoA transferase